MSMRNVGCFLGIIALLISACSHSGSDVSTNNQVAKSDKGTLFIDLGAEVPSLDPQLIEDMRSIRVANDLFAGLVSFDESNNIIPGLAKSWSVSDDGKTYLFTLRPNLKFSDGSSIKSSDVVYSWQRLVAPQTGSPYGLIANSILNAQSIIDGKVPASSLGVRALSESVVEVKLAYPDKAFLAKLLRPSFYVVSQSNVEKYGKQWTSPQHLVSSGAYCLKSHIINGSLTLTKNNYYSNSSQVKLTNVIFYPLVDSNTSLLKYKANELDMTWQIPVDQFNLIKNQYKEELQVTPIEAMVYYNINLLKPELRDVNLRKALSLAIDREVLANNVVGIGVKPLYSVVTNSTDGARYANLVYGWKPLNRTDQIELAKKYYKLAKLDKTVPLQLSITYGTNDEQKKIAIAIASMWSNVLGINVKVNNQDWKTFLHTRRTGNYDISFGRWYADYDDVSSYTPIYQCNSLVNYTKYCSLSYDGLINNAINTLKESQAQHYYSQALQLVLDSYSTIPLYQLVSARLVKPWVKGYPKANNLDMLKSEWLDKN